MGLNQLQARRVQSLPDTLLPNVCYLVQTGTSRFRFVVTDNAGTPSAYTAALDPKGAYDAETAYVVGNVVTDQGGAWMCIKDVTGTAPPTLPTTSNTNWILLVPPAEDGDPGDAATISVGTTTTLAAGSDATVSNSGSSSAAVLDFGIPKGDDGDPGTDGADGADGTDPGYLLTWSTSTTAPPSSGGIHADNASLSSATKLYVSKTSRGGSDIGARLSELDPGTKTEKSTVILTNPADDKQASFLVDSVTDQTGYVEIAVSSHAGETAFAAGAISLQREISGADGADGSGAGDMVASTYDPNNVAGDAFDQDNMVDGTTNKNFTATEKTKLAGVAAGAEVNVVDSVNAKTGAVVLDADDIDDTSTTNKFVTAADVTKLSNLSGTNTGDQTNITGNAGTATKLAAAVNIDGQEFDGSEDITVVAPATHAATSKTTPVDADKIPLVDSEASNVLAGLTWANFKAALKTYFDTLYAPNTSDLIFVIGDGVNAITTGLKGYLPVHFGGEIVSWALIGDASGSIAIDVWKSSFANAPPTSSDKISASAGPALSSEQKSFSSTLTGWTTSIAGGDVFGINVASASTVKQVTLAVRVTKA